MRADQAGQQVELGARRGIAPGHRAQTHIKRFSQSPGQRIFREEDAETQRSSVTCPRSLAGGCETRIQTRFCLFLNHQYLLALLASLEGPRLRGIQDWDQGWPRSLQADAPQPTEFCFTPAIPGLPPKDLDCANQCQQTHSHSRPGV